MGINFDTGHFGAAGYDAVAFVRENHQRTFILHLKDRRREQGPQMPLGEGDTRVKEILLLLRDRKWSIPCYLEHVVKEDHVRVMRRDFDWMKKALEG